MSLSALRWVESLELPMVFASTELEIEQGAFNFQTKVVDPWHRVILQYIAKRENPDRGYAWSTISDISVQVGCSTRTVIRKTKDLERAGWIKVERAARGSKKSNRYFCVVPCEYRHSDKQWMDKQGCQGCCETEQSARLPLPQIAE